MSSTNARRAKRLHACATALLFAAAALSSRADAQDAPASAAANSRAGIASAIEQASARRSGAISMIVIGGIAIVGGVVVTIAQTVEAEDDQYDENQRRYAAGNGNYDESDTFKPAGMVVGLAVGVPLVVAGSVSLTRSSRELRRLRRERARLSLAPARDGARLQLALDF